MSERKTESSSRNATGGIGFRMGSGWRRARIALGLSVCASAQPDPDDQSEDGYSLSTDVSTSELSNASHGIISSRAPSTPTRSSSRLHLIRTSIRLSRTTCAICLENMKPGQGAALFTAECSHTFHFSCIASNVRHGNLVCPVCRAQWKEVPWQAPADIPLGIDVQGPGARRGQHPLSWRQSPLRGEANPDAEEDQRRPDPVIRILDESIANARGIRRIGPQEPRVFDDDEPLDTPVATEMDITSIEQADGGVGNEGAQEARNGGEGSFVTSQHSVRENVGEEAGRRSVSRQGSTNIVLTCHPEVSAVSASEERGSFTVLVHLKSSVSCGRKQWDEIVEPIAPEERGNIEQSSMMDNELSAAQVLDPSCRAPLDLVTVIDVSGSMAGTKLMLLKRAMAFVIRNLSPADRLSVVAFSSSARRLFPLRRMVEEGRRHALRCVDSLVSTGGTNIADGLRKGAKMLDDRRMKNPVASIMLLSDGQDTYTIGNRGQFVGLAAPRNSNSPTDYTLLLPGSLRRGLRPGESQIPVHTFGFGADHDAATMHSIAEVSGGTFSFIQAEDVVQDAFAQCLGGLLSVVVQDVSLSISTGAPGIKVKRIDAGSYETSISEAGCTVKLGDLYADEERDILLDLHLPAMSVQMGQEEDSSTLVRVSLSFRDPVFAAVPQTPLTAEVHISRPKFVGAALQCVSLDVDRQRNRVRIAQSILEAGNLADAGDIVAAQQILVSAKEALYSSAAFQAGDSLSVSLDTELSEIQLRVANRQIYERTGRAYFLSAQSSHFHQRATTRGDFSENHSREYQTASMADMVTRSQALPNPRSSSAARSDIGSAERRTSPAGRSALSPSPTRMLLRRASGKVQDSHGHQAG